MPYTKIDDHADKAIARLIQVFRNKPNWQKFVRALAVAVQELEDEIYAVNQSRSIDDAEKAQLDLLGTIVGQPRDGREDDLYRIWIRARIYLNRSSGTIPEIVHLFSTLVTPAHLVKFEEYFPAGFVLRILQAGLTQEEATEFGKLLQEAKAGGVEAHLLYSQADADNTFTFATAEPNDPNKGFNGGQFAGVA